MKIKKKFAFDAQEYADLHYLCDVLCIDLEKMVRNDLRNFIRQNRHLLPGQEPEPAPPTPAPARRNWIEVDKK